MSIFSQVKKGLDSVSPRVFQDRGLTTELTWKVYKGNSWDKAQRKNVETFESFTVRVVKVMKEFNSTAPRALVPGAGGLIRGEIRYIVQMADAPEGYSYRDLFIEGDVTYSVNEYAEVLNEYVIIDVQGLG